MKKAGQAVRSLLAPIKKTSANKPADPSPAAPARLPAVFNDDLENPDNNEELKAACGESRRSFAHFNRLMADVKDVAVFNNQRKLNSKIRALAELMMSLVGRISSNPRQQPGAKFPFERFCQKLTGFLALAGPAGQSADAVWRAISKKLISDSSRQWGTLVKTSVIATVIQFSSTAVCRLTICLWICWLGARQCSNSGAMTATMQPPMREWHRA